MKLYYSPGACSLSPHIILRETNTPFELVKVDLKEKKTEDGRDFRQISRVGYVPTLELDDGTVLTEGPVIVQYLAEKANATHLMPQRGTIEWYRMLSWLNFITSELHKGFGPLFKPTMPEEGKAFVREQLLSRIAHLDQHLADKLYIMGENFTLPDAYAFTVLSWARPLKIDLSGFKNITAYLERVGQRPAVKEAMKAEGLIK